LILFFCVFINFLCHTGTSKGIGLGLVKQFLSKTAARVVATCRNPESADRLNELTKTYGKDRLLIHELDTTVPEHFKNVFNALNSDGINTLDVLIGNAGIAGPDFPDDPILTTKVEDMMNVYQTNCVGNLLLLQTFHPMLSKSNLKLAVMISSSRGSLTNAAEVEPEQAAYRASKAALNMIGVIYATDQEVKDAGIKLLLMHPGRRPSVYES
jgi:norsolorinic acid ketoreductase